MSGDDLKAMLESPAMYRRRSLLARMAGNIAAGLARDIDWSRPSPDNDAATAQRMRNHDRVASDAYEIAERILKRIGL